MKALILLSLCLGAVISTAAPSFRGCEHRVKENVTFPAQGWIQGSAAHPDSILRLQISLSQPRFGELEQHLMQISDPAHDRYGLHLSKEEVQELIAPHPDSNSVLAEWLAMHGIGEDAMDRSQGGEWVTISVPVRVAEEMFDTNFHVYHHVESGSNAIRTLSYSLPSVLHEHIDLVHPMTMHASPLTPKVRYTGTDSASELHLDFISESHVGSESWLASRANNDVDPSCATQVTPSCLRQLYNIGNYSLTSPNKTNIAVTGYTSEWANYADFTQFLQEEVPPAAAGGANFSVVSVTGGTNDQSHPGAESNLDVQYAFGLTWPMPATFYTVGGSQFDANWTLATGTLNLINYLLAQDEVPQVLSTSYGLPESAISVEQAKKVCQGFAALGVRGVSVLYSSGDYGVGYSPERTNASTFEPQFPASCPYVTAVGMTSGIAPEVAGQQDGYSSSGGFSNYFARPSYQNDTVNAYLSNLGQTYSGLYNSSGRGYPDVSAQGVNYLIIDSQRALNDTGTSASAPTFAAIVALLNDVRASQGKGSLGFLNPWLYSQGYQGLNDIIEGNNPGCGTQGFNATTGWDPVTGLGTPDFAKLKDLTLAV